MSWRSLPQLPIRTRAAGFGRFRRTPLRTSERVYRTIAFDVLQHGKFTCHVLRELSNFCCLPGRAGGSPNGLGWVRYLLARLAACRQPSGSAVDNQHIGDPQRGSTLLYGWRRVGGGGGCPALVVLIQNSVLRLALFNDL